MEQLIDKRTPLLWMVLFEIGFYVAAFWLFFQREYAAGMLALVLIELRELNWRIRKPSNASLEGRAAFSASARSDCCASNGNYEERTDK